MEPKYKIQQFLIQTLQESIYILERNEREDVERSKDSDGIINLEDHRIRDIILTDYIEERYGSPIDIISDLKSYDKRCISFSYDNEDITGLIEKVDMHKNKYRLRDESFNDLRAIVFCSQGFRGESDDHVRDRFYIIETKKMVKDYLKNDDEDKKSLMGVLDG